MVPNTSEFLPGRKPPQSASPPGRAVAGAAAFGLVPHLVDQVESGVVMISGFDYPFQFEREPKRGATIRKCSKLRKIYKVIPSVEKLLDEGKKLVKWLINYLFSPFHKKIVRWVIGIGSAILLDSYFFQGLIQWLLSASVAHFFSQSIPAYDGQDQSGVFGVILIGLALLYSLLAHFLEDLPGILDAKHQREVDTAKLSRDYDLYQKFLGDFGSSTGLAMFIKDHNFGNTWHSVQSEKLDNMCFEWDVPERKFLVEPLCDQFPELLSELQELRGLLAESSGGLRANHKLEGIFDPSIHDEMDMPTHIEKAIDDANRLSSSIAERRAEFVRVAEEKFALLS